mmetsp:Transcript_5543/g.6442  ORF Transcript_5543/g.6442 Transcript_5543/m.6442 type:complete len:463 (-) Transcript_5543:249-1637(-)
MANTYYDYKAEKEAFVSNLEGTTVTEVTLVLLIFPVSLCTEILLRSTIALLTSAKSIGDFDCVLGYVLICLPLLLSFTVCSQVEYLVPLYLAVTASGIVCFFLIDTRKRDRAYLQYCEDIDRIRKASSKKDGKKSKSITAFRTFVTLATVIAILAVDFRIFPRRFAKTETYGTGLMDIGVGCFVLSNSIVLDSKLRSGILSLLPSVPLLLLGFGRLVSSKELEYQEHASEYGLHWNFFFTLAFLNIAAGVIHRVFKEVYSPILYAKIGCLIIVFYQLLLTGFGLEAWILSGDRSNLVSQNKEGLCSSIGYLGLFFTGIWLGFLHRKTSTPLFPYNFLRHICVLFCLASACFVSSYFLPISRRLANLSYCIWVLTTSQLMLLSFEVVFTIPYVHDPSVLIHSINRNQLPIFLLSNLLTGICNFCINTLYTSDGWAFFILNCYLIVVCSCSIILHKRNYVLKFW